MSQDAPLRAPSPEAAASVAAATEQSACDPGPDVAQPVAHGLTCAREANPPAPASGAFEATEAGQQRLIAGIAPITFADRLRWRAAAPLVAGKPQRPCDLGLFDLAARNQLDLFTKLPPGRPDG